MICTYCDRPLICHACEVEFETQTREQYDAMARAEVPVICPTCEAIVVCHWCKTAYDGQGED